MYKQYFLSILSFFVVLTACKTEKEEQFPEPEPDVLSLSRNILDYKGTPAHTKDKNMLMYSDQGAWFAYSLPDSIASYGGFSGPFLLTQQNGVWINPSLSKLKLSGYDNKELMDWEKDLVEQNSYNSHLEQLYQNENLKVKQQLVFLSGNTSLQRISVNNLSQENIEVHSGFQGQLFDIGIKISKEGNFLKLTSSESQAIGYVQFVKENSLIHLMDDTHYTVQNTTFSLEPGQTREFLISQSFIFPEYSWEEEQQKIAKADFDSILQSRKKEKQDQLLNLVKQKNPVYNDTTYTEVLIKSNLTLQNNWRVPAGEIKYEGLFPSYHYRWFNGFWSWDSWKHAVGLALYNTDLAKNQVKLMFEFQNEDGFVADVVYRDTTIESHNYRDTKPPLSAWAVQKIYEKDNDIEFVKYMYPRLKKYHQWWYNKRDHDQDGMCEYGSTDGSLIAAKWESGMDNAVRFDDSKILKNEEGAYSLDQESVDLNSYLYAEKNFLASLADALGKNEEAENYRTEAEKLKLRIQEQFYDPETGWFYDTNLEGDQQIKIMGSEGWTALWAKAATQAQAEAVKNNMMNPSTFYTRVPFQTMTADHPKFNPLKGYWRGPNWLDQAYFGVRGLKNYGFDNEAEKAAKQIIKGAEGILGKGSPIRENYHPINGQGLNAKNFSWSAAHLMMLLTDK
ncbi:trehalase [Leptobacterium flavescens]|uniref:Trehalase n=1 Tax=Leptobacterium flavescens TaxID=472055 RepID=A0A6P0UHS3_9FLAO|nr:trehalase family glycosidase [Leptobacterium flavescens]NER12794.1 trehalase [Leptobacterium flavescens]